MVYSYTSAFCHFTSFADLSEIKIDRWQSNRIVLVSGKLMCFALKFLSEIALISCFEALAALANAFRNVKLFEGNLWNELRKPNPWNKGMVAR